MAGGGVALIGMTLVPLLAGAFRLSAGRDRLWAAYSTNSMNGSAGCSPRGSRETVGHVRYGEYQSRRDRRGSGTDAAGMEQRRLFHDPEPLRTVIVPIAGVILTFVMCYELIQLVAEKTTCTTWIPGVLQMDIQDLLRGADRNQYMEYRHGGL